MKISGIDWGGLLDSGADYGKKGINLADKTGAIDAGWNFASDKAKGTIFEKLLPGGKTVITEKKVLDKKLLYGGAAAIAILGFLLLKKK